MGIDVRSLLAGGVFGVWALATLLHGTDRFRDRVRALDVLEIVPEWRFFGRHPGRVDFYLLYRDRLSDGDFTDWIEIPLITPRPWHAFLFNPRRRAAKALMDTVIHLSQEIKVSPDALVGALPYIALLHHVSAMWRGPRSTHRQFLLLQTTADREDAEPELVVLSDLHELETAD
jgi:hypothetical protein